MKVFFSKYCQLLAKFQIEIFSFWEFLILFLQLKFPWRWVYLGGITWATTWLRLEEWVSPSWRRENTFSWSSRPASVRDFSSTPVSSPLFLHWALSGSWLESDDETGNSFLQTQIKDFAFLFKIFLCFFFLKKKIYKIKFDNIFYLGNGLDNNVILYLKDSELKLSLQLGSEQLKTGVSKVLFNDSKWHKVDILRRAEKVRSSHPWLYSWGKFRWKGFLDETQPSTFCICNA